MYLFYHAISHENYECGLKNFILVYTQDENYAKVFITKYI